MWTKISSSFSCMLFVYSINKYLLGTYYMPGPAKGIKNILVNEIDKNHCPSATYTLYWGRLTKNIY